MKQRIVIIGYDSVSPLGTTGEEQWLNASLGKSGIGPLTRFPLSDEFPVRIAGQVGDIDTASYAFLSPREMAQWKSPIFTYSLLVAHRALHKSGLEITPSIAPRVGITFSSAVGGLDAVITADRKMTAQGGLPHPFTNPNSCINMPGGKVSILTGATGPIVSTITACATGSTSMIVGSMLIRQGMADVVICGAADCSIVEPIVGGFASMNGAYKNKPSDPEEPSAASRPFSINRRGFIVSEGAGCIVICSEEFAKAHGLPFKIELVGYSMTSDAHHFVAPHLPTVHRCISDSISDAGLSPEDIDAINAHGTSTKAGDSVEWSALDMVFPRGVPPVTANKSMTGHAMGASSAIESILAMDGMLKGKVLPTINHTPDPEIPIDCIAEGMRTLEQEFVLKNSFGFGGCNSCLVFRHL